MPRSKRRPIFPSLARHEALLLDQNLSPQIADWLADAGVECAHVRDLGLRAASDETILEFAAAEGYVIVSQDSDFSALLAHHRASRPSNILIRISSAANASAIAALLRTNLGAMTGALELGAIVSITDDHIRVRRLPLR